MKIILAITGASGSVYALRLMLKLKNSQTKIDEVALIYSETGRKVYSYELQQEHNPYSFREFRNDNLFSAPASGSAAYDVMFVCPCSVGTMGKIAAGLASDLISRAADVMLKERRKLILVLRESPYNLLHINNMKLLTESGAIIFPASPSFYSKPVTIEQLVDTVIDRVLQIAGIQVDVFRWDEPAGL
jgi:flavin prenyltransferase